MYLSICVQKRPKCSMHIIVPLFAWFSQQSDVMHSACVSFYVMSYLIIHNVVLATDKLKRSFWTTSRPPDSNKWIERKHVKWKENKRFFFVAYLYGWIDSVGALCAWVTWKFSNFNNLFFFYYFNFKYHYMQYRAL